MLQHIHVFAYGALDSSMGTDKLPKDQDEDAVVLRHTRSAAAILRS